MQRLRGWYALGLLVGLAGCANVHRPSATAPPSLTRGAGMSSVPYASTRSQAGRVPAGRSAAPAAPTSSVMAAHRVGDPGGLTGSLARYFPSLAAPANPEPAAPRPSLFARNREPLTPTGARLAGRAPATNWNRSSTPLAGMSGTAPLASAPRRSSPASAAPLAPEREAPSLPLAMNVQAYPETPALARNVIEQTESESESEPEPVETISMAAVNQRRNEASSTPVAPASDSDPLPLDPLERALAATLGTIGTRDDRARLVAVERAETDTTTEAPGTNPETPPQRLLDVQDMTASAAAIVPPPASDPETDLSRVLQNDLDDIPAPLDTETPVFAEVPVVEPELVLDPSPELAPEPTVPDATTISASAPAPVVAVVEEDPALAGRPRLPLVRPEPTAINPARMVGAVPPSEAVAAARAGVVPPNALFPPSYYVDADAARNGSVAVARGSQVPPATSEEPATIRGRLRKRLRSLNPFRNDTPDMTSPAMSRGDLSPPMAPGDSSITRTALPVPTGVSAPGVAPPTVAPVPPAPATTAPRASVGIPHRPDCPCTCQD